MLLAFKISRNSVEALRCEADSRGKINDLGM